MLNTAKVIENNPVALRLKELEVLERIAEKIDRIQVNGSLDSILTDLIKIDSLLRHGSAPVAGTRGDRAKWSENFG